MVCSIGFWALGIYEGNNQIICCWKRAPPLLWELWNENGILKDKFWVELEELIYVDFVQLTVERKIGEF
jgi:hypothetical protein